MNRTSLWRRLLMILVVAGSLAWWLQSSPREVTLYWRLNGKSENLSRMKIDLWEIAEESPKRLVRHTELFFSVDNPAPEVVSQSVKLPKANYRAEVVLYYSKPERIEKITADFALDQQEVMEILLTKTMSSLSSARSVASYLFPVIHGSFLESESKQTSLSMGILHC